MKENALVNTIKCELIKTISDTNGITLHDTLELLGYSDQLQDQPDAKKALNDFTKMLAGFQNNLVTIHDLLKHPVSFALFDFLNHFHFHITKSIFT